MSRSSLKNLWRYTFRSHTERSPRANAMVSRVTTHDASFQTHDPTIGQEGRLPPPLTGIGGKLQDDWLRATIAHGQRERPYLRTRHRA